MTSTKSFIRLRTSPLRFAVLVVAVALGVSLLPSDTNAAPPGEVRTQGDTRVVTNAHVISTLKFAPGHVNVSSGQEITLTHVDKTQDPHTLSIVDEDELPQTADDVFNCGSPGTVCDEIFNAPPSTGIGERLDTLFVLPGESVSAEITADPGTTLFFLCAIHPWMQGEINVR